MDLPDNNVLIYAFRPEMALHNPAKSWLESSLNNRQPIRLFPTVEVGFARVATHPKIFNPPALMDEVSDFLKTLSESPLVESVSWTGSSRIQWLELCEEMNLQGNDCNDALLAAVAIDRGLRLVTFDRGFQRFANLSLLLLDGAE